MVIDAGKHERVASRRPFHSRITQQVRVTYTFDFGNRLRSVGSSPASSYVYDGHGRRVRDYVGASKFSQYDFSGQLVYTSDYRTQVWSAYIYLGGSLVAINETPQAGGAATVKYQHTDALGSPVAVTNQARTVLERNEYEPYGKVLNHPLKDGPGYTGHVADAATGLDYMQQRYYDPGIGRFLSVDPVTADGNTGGNFNRYWYANNNPYKFTDPDGRETVCVAKQCTMTSDTYDPAKSNGQTTLASSEVRGAVEAGKNRVRAETGPEKMGFVTKGTDGNAVLKAASNVSTGSTRTGSIAGTTVPEGALAGAHGHIETGEKRSNGMVDDPVSNGGYGDTQLLRVSKLPQATVFKREVGWHEIKNGQLQFTYKDGALKGNQIEKMQNNLNKEQRMFELP